MVKKEYFAWADGVRAMAVVGMVLVHVSAGIVSQFEIVNSRVWLAAMTINTLGRSGVPLFVMLSGCLLLRNKQSTIFFYRRRLVRLVVPWVFWVSVLTLWLGSHVDKLELWEWGRLWISTLLSGYWFLPIIFGLYVVTPLLWKIEKYWEWLVVGWFLYELLWLMSEGLGIMRISKLPDLISYSGYYLLGWELGKNTKKIPYPVVLALAIIFGVSVGVGRMSQMRGAIDWLLMSEVSLPIILLGSLIFATVRVELHGKIDNLWFRIVKQLSGASLGIVFVHMYFLEWLMRLWRFDDQSSGNVVFYLLSLAGLVLLLSWMLVKLVAKIPILRWVSGVSEWRKL